MLKHRLGLPGRGKKQLVAESAVRTKLATVALVVVGFALGFAEFIVARRQYKDLTYMDGLVARIRGTAPLSTGRCVHRRG